MSVTLDPKVIAYLDRLTDTLIDKHYFSNYEASLIYIRKIVFHAVDYIPILPAKRAPERFKRYGWPLFYITYRPNKATSWYIFYMKSGHRYLVTYITNNHVNAQHIRGLR